jgi:hypothetical protein
MFMQMNGNERCALGRDSFIYIDRPCVDLRDIFSGVIRAFCSGRRQNLSEMLIYSNSLKWPADGSGSLIPNILDRLIGPVVEGEKPLLTTTRRL